MAEANRGHGRGGRGRGRGRMVDPANEPNQRHRDPRDIEIEEQRQRIEDLERRLALAKNGDPTGEEEESDSVVEEEEGDDNPIRNRGRNQGFRPRGQSTPTFGAMGRRIREVERLLAKRMGSKRGHTVTEHDVDREARRNQQLRREVIRDSRHYFVLDENSDSVETENQVIWDQYPDEETKCHVNWDETGCHVNWVQDINEEEEPSVVWDNYVDDYETDETVQLGDGTLIAKMHLRDYCQKAKEKEEKEAKKRKRLTDDVYELLYSSKDVSTSSKWEDCKPHVEEIAKQLEEGNRTENLQAQRCRARLEHLESAEVDNMSEWNSIRLKRVLVDYVLRMSYYDTAEKLAESNNMRDLVDIDVFHEAKKVIYALQSKEVGPALAWCVENKFRLKSSKSKFEFQLRLQELVGLVRAENNMRAISYAPGGLSMGQVVQEAEPVYSGVYEGLCLCSSRLFLPLWELLVFVFKGATSEEGIITCKLDVGTMHILEDKIRSLESIMFLQLLMWLILSLYSEEQEEAELSVSSNDDIQDSRTNLFLAGEYNASGIG